jgi:hypothetical protein
VWSCNTGQLPSRLKWKTMKFTFVILNSFNLVHSLVYNELTCDFYLQIKIVLPLFIM